MDELIALIGEPLDSPIVKAFLQAQSLERGQLDDPYDNLRWLSSKGQGYEIQHRKGRKGRIDVVFIYPKERDGYSPFQGQLSNGLRRSNSRAAVRRSLGPPTRSGAVGDHEEWHFDRFDSQKVCIHVAYGLRASGIRMITLMAPDVAP